MDKDTLQARIKQFPFWYHKIKLPIDGGGTLVTPGWAPLEIGRAHV